MILLEEIESSLCWSTFARRTTKKQEVHSLAAKRRTSQVAAF